MILGSGSYLYQWIDNAAIKGNPNAQYSIGIYHILHDRDEQGVSMLKMSAEHGHIKAQSRLGWIYQLGRGGISHAADSDKQALIWYSKAAKQGDVVAQSRLGRMYEEGRWVRQSSDTDKQALYWYTKAAEQGNAIAQLNLGWMYAKGRVNIEDPNSRSRKSYQERISSPFNIERAFGRDDWVDEIYRKQIKNKYYSGDWTREVHRKIMSYEYAKKWLFQAATQGGVATIFSYCLVLTKGPGGIVDYPYYSNKQTVNWYINFSENNHQKHQFILCLLSRVGELEKSKKQINAVDREAMQWLQLAAEQGFDPAVNILNRLKKMRINLINKG